MNYKDYFKKVKGCFIGKTVGGTLGMSFEGYIGTKEITYYDPVPTEMIANDDLDNQVIWLETIKRFGLPINHRILGDAFRRHVLCLFDEYCTSVRNMENGIYPPLSGAYDSKFTAGMGASIRTEIWACLAPGDPALAAKLAREDSCLDHCDAGVDAAVFIAAVESAAFVEKDEKKLVEIGLSFLNPQKRIHKILSAVVSWVESGLSIYEIRELVLHHFFDPNWTDVGINLAFIVTALLTYGGDFSKGICDVTGCGHDADCTGATLGSILGILNPDGIDSKWTDPIGDKLVLGGNIGSIHEMDSIAEFCVEISRMAPDVLSYYHSDFTVTELPEELEKLPSLRVWAAHDAFLSLPGDYDPHESLVSLSPLTVKLIYPQNVAIALGETADFAAKFSNPNAKPCSFTVELQAPNGWAVTPNHFEIKLDVKEEATVNFSVTAPKQTSRRRAKNPLDIYINAPEFSYTVTAGLVQSFAFAHTVTERDFDSCPTAADFGDFDIVNARAHFFPVIGGKNLYQTEFHTPYYVPEAILVIQGTRGVKVWLDDELILEHDGAEYAPCVHRSEYLKRMPLTGAWQKLTILTDDANYDGTKPENNPHNGIVVVPGCMPVHEFRAKYDGSLGKAADSELFVDIGERNAYRWINDIEWRLPAEFLSE